MQENILFVLKFVKYVSHIYLFFFYYLYIDLLEYDIFSRLKKYQ